MCYHFHELILFFLLNKEIYIKLINFNFYNFYNIILLKEKKFYVPLYLNNFQSILKKYKIIIINKNIICIIFFENISIIKNFKIIYVNYLFGFHYRLVVM